MAHIMVLNDGETFTTLKGCKIVWVDDKMSEDSDDVENILKNMKWHEDHGQAELITEFK